MRVAISAAVLLVLLHGCGGVASDAVSTLAASPTQDIKATAAAAYLALASRLNEQTASFNAAPHTDPLSDAFQLVDDQLVDVEATLPKIAWPIESKQYADAVFEAARTLDLQLDAFLSTPTESQMPGLLESLGKLQANVALLRASLGLPAAPTSSAGGQSW